MVRNSSLLIGVSGPDEGGWPAWILTKFALWRAGARACRITPRRHFNLDELDGLIIGGGADVNPELYSEAMLPQIRRERRKVHRSFCDYAVYVFLWILRKICSSPWHEPADHERDVLETELIKKAVERGLPVLGICRGMQLLNVHFGGSLYQEIGSFYQESSQLHTHLPKKKVEIQPGTKLHHLLSCTMTRVNSLHFQSVKKLGKGLHISATEPTGVVQAIEHEEYCYILGVQWHPEFMPQDRTQQELFVDLVRVALARRYIQISPTAIWPSFSWLSETQKAAGGRDTLAWASSGR